MRLRLAPYLRKPPPIFASGKHFVQLYHWQTSHTQGRCPTCVCALGKILDFVTTKTVGNQKLDALNARRTTST